MVESNLWYFVLGIFLTCLIIAFYFRTGFFPWFKVKAIPFFTDTFGKFPHLYYTAACLIILFIIYKFFQPPDNIQQKVMEDIYKMDTSNMIDTILKLHTSSEIELEKSLGTYKFVLHPTKIAEKSKLGFLGIYRNIIIPNDSSIFHINQHDEVKRLDNKNLFSKIIAQIYHNGEDPDGIIYYNGENSQGKYITIKIKNEEIDTFKTIEQTISNDGDYELVHSGETAYYESVEYPKKILVYYYAENHKINSETIVLPPIKTLEYRSIGDKLFINVVDSTDVKKIYSVFGNNYFPIDSIPDGNLIVNNDSTLNVVKYNDDQKLLKVYCVNTVERLGNKFYFVWDTIHYKGVFDFEITEYTKIISFPDSNILISNEHYWNPKYIALKKKDLSIAPVVINEKGYSSKIGDSLFFLSENEVIKKLYIYRDAQFYKVKEFKDFDFLAMPKKSEKLFLIGKVGNIVDAVIYPGIDYKTNQYKALGEINLKDDSFKIETKLNPFVTIILSAFSLCVFVLGYVIIKDFTVKTPVSPLEYIEGFETVKDKLAILQKNIKRLRINSDGMLFLGIIIGILGIGSFLLYFESLKGEIDPNAPFQTSHIFSIIKPVALLLFIESLSVYFLKQYRIIFQEYKLFLAMYLRVYNFLNIYEINTSDKLEPALKQTLNDKILNETYDLSGVQKGEEVTPIFQDIIKGLLDKIPKK